MHLADEYCLPADFYNELPRPLIKERFALRGVLQDDRLAALPDHGEFFLGAGAAGEGFRGFAGPLESESFLKEVMKFSEAGSEGRALIVITASGEEEDTNEVATRGDEAGHGLSIIVPPVERDGAKAGVLEDEVIEALPLKEVSKSEAEIPGGVSFICGSDGICRDVESEGQTAGDLANEGGIVPKATTWNEDGSSISEKIAMGRQQKRKLRMGLPFFPGCVAGLITSVPVDSRHPV